MKRKMLLSHSVLCSIFAFSRPDSAKRIVALKPIIAGQTKIIPVKATIIRNGAIKSESAIQTVSVFNFNIKKDR